MTPEERQRRIREIADRLAERLVDHWPEDVAHVNDIEHFVEEISQDLQHEITERALQEGAERKDDNQTACPCGGTATYCRHHDLTVVTAAGPPPG